MSRQVLNTAWYRFAATFGRRWGGYLTVAVLIALMGGLAMGSIAGARRTQSSFTTYIASTNPSYLTVGTAIYSPGLASTSGYDPSLLRHIARLRYVARAESYAGFGRNVQQLLQPGADAPVNGFIGGVSPIGSSDGEFSDQDRVTIVAGRMPDPGRPDEFVVSATAAKEYGVRVGDVYPLGFYTNAQTYLSGYGTASIAPHLRIDATVTGLALFSNEVVEDDIDVPGNQYALFTPALTRMLEGCCSTDTFTALTLTGGDRHLAAVEAELGPLIPPAVSLVAGPPFLTSVAEAKADRAIKPEAIAFGVFGAITALAALLIAAQVIGRQLRFGADDLTVLRALGASPAMTASDGLLGLLGAVVAGSVAAVAVAVGLSPLAPLGPVRLEPDSGVAFDWTVLGLGLLVLIAGLCTAAVVISWRLAPERVTRRRERAGPRGSRLPRTVAGSDLPLPAVAGMRFALDPGDAKNTVPVRSAILGATLAVIVVIASVAFGASLSSLVAHPRLYGWNWNYELASAGGQALGNIPANQAATLLDRDPRVAAWSGVYFSSLELDDETVPVLGARPGAAVQPPVLSGHGFDGPNQVVLGATTLARLHKAVGDTISVRSGNGPRARLVIVGTATMPATGIPGLPHLELGTGALLDYRLIAPGSRNVFGNPLGGPNAIFVRLGRGNPAAGEGSLRRIVRALNASSGQGSVAMESVQRPAEIVNYRALGATPAVLGLALGAGAAVALGLTLVASVRRRRRDLALLKTLGFTASQLAGTVAWQSTISVAVGTVVGLPIGIVLGRILWVLFAHQIDVVPAPEVPVVSVVVIVLGALALANLVALVPGWIAARTPTALLLRAE